MHTKCNKSLSPVVKAEECHFRTQQITDLMWTDRKKAACRPGRSAAYVLSP